MLAATVDIEKGALLKHLEAKEQKIKDLTERNKQLQAFLDERNRDFEDFLERERGKDKTIIFQAQMIEKLGSGPEVIADPNVTLLLGAKNQEFKKLEEESAKKSQTINEQTLTISGLTKQISDFNITLTHYIRVITKQFNSDPRVKLRTRKMTYLLFLESAPKGLTRDELIEAYERKYGKGKGAADAVRRCYELTKPDFGSLLFIHSDDDGTTRFFLTVNPTPENLKLLDNPIMPKKKTVAAAIQEQFSNQLGRSPTR